MRIAVDIRSLIEPFPSGVTEYTRQIIKYLLASDTENEYLLFCNAAHGLPSSCRDELHALKARLIERRIPSKLLNSSLYFLNYPKLDRLVGGADILFLPNVNFMAVTRRAKLVVTVHDVSFTYPRFYAAKGRLWHRAVRPRRILRRADLVLAVSESTKHDLERVYGVPASAVTVVPLGVTAESFQHLDVQKTAAIRQQYHLTAPFFLYVGTVEARKNVSGLLAAWELFQEQYSSSYQLVVAGRITDERLPRRYPNVRWLGYVPESDKPHLYHSAFVFVYPSYYEGFGLPVLEAMAAGLPVITSFSTSLPEVGSGAVLLVDPYNVGEIAEAMKQLAQSSALRQRLIERGRALAQHFTWEKTAQATLRAFKHLIQT